MIKFAEVCFCILLGCITIFFVVGVATVLIDVGGYWLMDLKEMIRRWKP